MDEPRAGCVIKRGYRGFLEHKITLPQVLTAELDSLMTLSSATATAVEDFCNFSIKHDKLSWGPGWDDFAKQHDAVRLLEPPQQRRQQQLPSEKYPHPGIFFGTEA